MFKKSKKKVEVEQVRKEPYNRPAGRWPSGCALRDPSGQVWFIKNNKRFRCFSPRTTWSWNFKILEVGPETIKSIPKGGILGFRDGSLIKDVSDAKYI